MQNKKLFLTNITVIFFLYNLFKLYHIRRRSKILTKIYQNHLVIDNMIYNKKFKKNILMIGDSTTVGVGVVNQKNHMYNLLSKHYNANVDIIAKSGMRLKNSDIILDGLKEHLLYNKKRYDIIFISLGINDSWNNIKNINISNFINKFNIIINKIKINEKFDKLCKLNLKLDKIKNKYFKIDITKEHTTNIDNFFNIIINLKKDEHSKVFFITTNYLEKNNKIPYIIRQNLISNYNKLIFSLLNIFIKYKIILVNINFNTLKDYINPFDKIHLNDEGHKYMFNKFIEEVKNNKNDDNINDNINDTNKCN